MKYIVKLVGQKRNELNKLKEVGEASCSGNTENFNIE